MSEKKINEIDEMYNEYERIVRNNIVKYTAICASIFLAFFIVKEKGFVIIDNISTTAMVGTAFAASLAVPTIISARDFNKNIKDFKDEHKGYDFPKNVFKIEKKHQKAVKKAEREFRNDYIEKCEEVKKEVSSPVYADLRYYSSPQNEKVKVKVKTR